MSLCLFCLMIFIPSFSSQAQTNSTLLHKLIYAQRIIFELFSAIMQLLIYIHSEICNYFV